MHWKLSSNSSLKYFARSTCNWQIRFLYILFGILILKLVCLLIHCRLTMPVRDCMEIRSCCTNRLLPNVLMSSLEYSTSTSSPYPELSPNDSDDAEEEDEVDVDVGR